MCARSNAALEVKAAADGLARACLASEPEPMRSLRAIYNDTLKEEIPEDLKRLLDDLN